MAEIGVDNVDHLLANLWKGGGGDNTVFNVENLRVRFVKFGVPRCKTPEIRHACRWVGVEKRHI